MWKACRHLTWLPVLVVACGGNADLGGGADAGSCAAVCCVPSPIGIGTPSFQCVAPGTACTLPNSACEAPDAGGSCAQVCCNPPPGGRGSPSFQCVAAGVTCTLPDSDCIASDAGVPPAVDGGGTPCTKTADCSAMSAGGTPYVCAYPLATGCNATGTCVQAGPLCNMATPIACACDGTSVAYGECSGYPTGYAGKPTIHTGACEAGSAADAGACQTAADCGPNEVCVQDYDPQVGPNPVSSKCIANPCGTSPLACSCAVTPACYGFSVNCAIASGGVVQCLGNG